MLRYQGQKYPFQISNKEGFFTLYTISSEIQVVVSYNYINSNTYPFLLIDALNITLLLKKHKSKSKLQTLHWGDEHRCRFEAIYGFSAYASTRTCKLLMTDAVRPKARIFQLDMIGAFLRASMRGRVFITLPKFIVKSSQKSRKNEANQYQYYQ